MDIFDLPPKFRGDVQIFPGPNSRVTNSTQVSTWYKPRRGYTFAHIIAVGGGAGGGGGHSAAAGNARGGGGGGGGGGCARLTIPLVLLPEALTLQVGAGGNGGLPTQPGGDGTHSVVLACEMAFLAVDNTIIRSGNGAATNGVQGTATGGGAGGAAGAVTNGTQHAVFATLGFFSATASMSMIVSQSGAAGGAHTGANGGDLIIPATSTFVCGGCGGAGTQSADFQGGTQTLVSDSWLSAQTHSTRPAAGSVNGGSGIQVWKPFFSFGGQGGSSSNTDVGGNGGHAGSFGGGGGGGGGGTTGGSGGDGGPGVIIIICW